MRTLARAFLIGAFVAPSSLAFAANSTNGAPPAARKEGGIAGDPRGAIRAIGGTSQTNFKQSGSEVKIPPLGSREGRGLTGGPPAGTTGPR